MILFLGGMAVGTTIGGDDRGDFGRGDFHGQMSPDGGQGYGHDFDQDGDGGHHWDQDGSQGYGQPQQAPSTAPSVAPSTTPQAYYQ